MDYKPTLNLPATNFSMKANLPQNEPKTIEFWRKEDIYAKIRSQSRARPKYVLHDGPPYANGNIHIGHGLNKILKDMIIRFKTMRGFDSPYIPGWDCHGLPVEHQLFKELNITKEQISQLDFRSKAGDYALRFVNLQREEFKRLGIFADWDHPYLTLNKEYEYEIVRALGALVRKGFIYRGLKPVNWCVSCETALAEAEVEYEDKTSPSVFVKFKLTSGQKLSTIDYQLSTDAYLVIWTTTPWTLYGNAAAAAHPDLEYALVKTEKGNLIIARDLLGPVFKELGLDEKEAKVEKLLRGRDLEGLAYEHPLLKDGIARKVILADYVSKEEGSGLVHIAPGHGQEDYFAGLKYGLPILMPVDKKGRFDKSVPEFSGQDVLAANRVIIEKLDSLGSLLAFNQKQHSYPHCWRCKSPIIFRAVHQWFLNIEHNDLRKKALEAIGSQVNFVPAAGYLRIKAMLESRPDWCLSRQRYWGVPIPALRCGSCGEEALLPEVVDNFADKVLSQGSDAWYKEELETFLPPNLKCHNCAGTKWSRGEDILDVWFDSGVSHRAVLMRGADMEFPASLYLEGSDQHRGWFQASLIAAMALEGKPPFKSVLTHGFVVDGSGRKMSKSLGNVISPQEIINSSGADILRLWAASSNYSEDVRVSADILSRLSEAYRKIRNTIRFLLGNLSDFSPEEDCVEHKDMLEIDRYGLSALHTLLSKVTRHYEEFEFYRAYQETHQFCILQMSNFYLDILKDRLYTFKKNGLERRSAQTVMWESLTVLVRIIAPILPFTCEEVWQHMAKGRNTASVHLAAWPEVNIKYIDSELENKWYNLIQFRAKVLKVLEEKRAAGEIGSSLEAKVVIGINSDNAFLRDFKEILPEVFIVSAVSLEEAPAVQAPIEVSKAAGSKCPRCWNYSEKIGESAVYPDICPKCVRALT